MDNYPLKIKKIEVSSNTKNGQNRVFHRLKLPSQYSHFERLIINKKAPTPKKARKFGEICVFTYFRPLSKFVQILSSNRCIIWPIFKGLRKFYKASKMAKKPKLSAFLNFSTIRKFSFMGVFSVCRLRPKLPA